MKIEEMRDMSVFSTATIKETLECLRLSVGARCYVETAIGIVAATKTDVIDTIRNYNKEAWADNPPMVRVTTGGSVWIAYNRKEKP